MSILTLLAAHLIAFDCDLGIIGSGSCYGPGSCFPGIGNGEFHGLYAYINISPLTYDCFHYFMTGEVELYPLDIGDNSCYGLYSCGYPSGSKIGSNSCRGSYSCAYLYNTTIIGDYSCIGDDTLIGNVSYGVCGGVLGKCRSKM